MKFRFIVLDREVWRFELDLGERPQPVPEPLRKAVTTSVKRFSRAWFRGMVA